MVDPSTKSPPGRAGADNGGPAPPRATRAYHKKSRTGCLTCKTRRKRCDEAKPSCQRCIDSGWKCEGYAAPQPKQKAISHHGFLPVGSTSSPEFDSSTTVLPTRQKLPLWPAKPRAHDADHDQDETHGISALETATIADSSTALTTRAATLSPHMQLANLALPWRSPEEIRSYQFFLGHAAPNFANSFDGEFWLGEVPRACHADPAIWHSVVSLGSVFEIYLETMRSGSKGTSQLTNPKYRFALQQFNTAIQNIVEAPHSVTATPWRALTVSVLFIYICAIQGLHAQSRVHLKAAFNMLREIDGSNTNHQTPRLILPSPPPTLASSMEPPREMPSGSPVSLGPLRAMISTLSVHSSSLDHGNLTHASEMFEISDIYGLWRYYKSPNPSSSHSRGPYGTATREALYNANRACFSAMNGLLFIQTERIPDILMLLMTNDTAALDRLNVLEEPIHQCHMQIGTALRRFQRDLGIDDDDWSIGESSAKAKSIPRSLLKSYYTLRMCHLSCSLMFCRSRWATGLQESPGKFVSTYMAMLNLAERILTMKPLDPFDPPIPGPNTNQPLCMVCFDGYPRSLRLRAIKLLKKYPQREGLWDSAFGAALADLTMAREKSARAERLAREGGTDTTESPQTNVSDEDEAINLEYEKISILDRMFKSFVEYKGERRARVYFATVYEVWNGITGQYLEVEW